MRKMMLAAFVAVLTLFSTATAFADTAVTTNVEVTVNNPKHFNGSWMTVEHYGDPANAQGLQASQEVKAQQKAYKDAKDAGDVEKMVANSFWTSVQAWALNNAGHKALQAITEPMSSQDTKDKASAAKSHLERALAILDNAPALGEPTEKQKRAFENELDQRKRARAKVESNLLYAKRLLGLEPWPKASK